MKAEELAELGVKLLGVFCALKFIASLPVVLPLQKMEGLYRSIEADVSADELNEAFSTVVLAFTSTTFLYLVFALIFLGVSSNIARWFVRSDDEVTFPFKTEPFSRFVLQILGLYALITWLPEFVQALVRTFIYGTGLVPQLSTLERFYQNGSFLVAPLLGSLLGFFLLFRVNGVLRLIRLARPLSKQHDQTISELSDS